MNDSVKKTIPSSRINSRLRFKKSSRPLDGGRAVEDGSNDSTRKPTTTSSNNSHTTEGSQTVPEFAEWGPEINGYRFVGAKDALKHYRKRNWLVNENMPSATTSGQQQFYDWSYVGVPGDAAEPTNIDLLEERYRNWPSASDGAVYTYGDYFKEWESIRSEGHRSVIFPLTNATDELNLDNVRSFLETSDDYGKALKMERIRWHPDKMLHTLKISHDDREVGDELLVKKITNTFQIINDLWQTLHK